LADELAWSLETFTASDGYRWHYRRYSPRGAAKAHVVCVHGIQSHAGWYEYSCKRLAEAGYSVSFLDRRGSGSNEVDRGDAPSFRRLLDDVAEFLRSGAVGAWSGDHAPTAGDHAPTAGDHGPTAHAGGSRLNGDEARSSVFLLAVSWGGKLAAALQRRHPGLVDGLLLLCPGFRPRVGPTWAERWAILRARLIAPGRLFPIPLNDPALFTANLDRQRFLRDDPLALHHATARFLVESARLDGYLRWVPRYVRVPTLLLLAEKDRIIDNERTCHFVERFAATDKEVVTYPGAHHTLEFESEPDRFITDMSRWLDRHGRGR
jgi:alpha-beta hydrolase superfamily lysophospholipase